MGKIKRVAGTDEPTAGVEVIVEIVEVQIPPVAIPVEVRHVAIAVRIIPDINAQNTAYTTILRGFLNDLRIESNSVSKIP